MTEDNFEEFIQKAAQGYNAPPTRAPREEMWSAIQAQRAAGPRVVYGGGLRAGQTAVRRFSSRIWLGAASAAVLLLATGVGIGRWTTSSTNPAPAATVNPTNTAPSPELTDAPSQGSASEGSRGVASGQTGVRRGSEMSPTTDRSRGVPRLDTPTGNGARVAAGGPSSNSSAASAYQLAAVRHLSDAEALLTSFRTRSTTDQQMDAQLGSWARDLLSNTRLLLDSPVGNDPQRRPLLEDLELVLVQIVQLSPGSTQQDRELIEKTLQQDHVMTRLRTAIPAGSQRGS